MQLPELADRIHAAGDLSRVELAANLSACDVLLQPFYDGATSRRTSLMAGLALGRTIVTNLGNRSESLWASSSAVALAASPSAKDLLQVAQAVLSEPDRWQELGIAAFSLYRSTFSLDRILNTLLEHCAIEAGLSHVGIEPRQPRL
jgi:glycosyltransferase involved in cell wall biosynthesis